MAVAAALAACDAGTVGTSANPDLSFGGTGFVYSGPAARNVEVSNFQFYLYNNVNQDNRCGGCHNSQASSPVSPLFFDTTDVNAAYNASLAYVDLDNPPASGFVQQMNSGHSCWEPLSSICGTLIAGWIEDWKNAANGGVASRQINLQPPDSIRDPGDAKSFPAGPADNGADSFAQTVYPILVGTAAGIGTSNCQGCHSETSAEQQAPFFASGDVNAAYEAAKSKMNIDTPANSRMVVRVRDGHNFWSGDQNADADRLQAAITQFAAAIEPTVIDPNLVTSKALTLGEGIIASGGQRHETDQFAIWEFKTGSGLRAFDTSGIDPSIHLSLIGSVDWVGGYGLEFRGGRAQADTLASDKLYTYIRSTGEYALEAWVIPANVSQENTNIVSYSGGTATRNFTLSQTLYDYEAYNRVDSVQPQAQNGMPFLSTGQNDLEIAQASLQHVVVNYDPFSGRSIYVNGELVPDLVDQAGANTSVVNAWDEGFAFVLGGEIGGSRAWRGQIKMVAMHNRALTPAQIQQNFDVGVGQKFFLLFWVGQHLGEDIAAPQSFIMFEVAQFDSYGYLFNKPTFINLDPAWVPGSIAIRGLRIGVNGKQALAGQAYANLDTTVDAGSYDASAGQLLSPLGTVIALDKGVQSDEFFLTFETFGAESNPYTDIQPSLPVDPADPPSPVSADIGLRTFEEISATISAITGIPMNDDRTFNGVPISVKSTYDTYIQQLPTAETIGAFLPSHQMAIAQLTLASCNTLVESNPGYFSGFLMNQDSRTAFGEPPSAPYYSPPEPTMGTPLTAQQIANRDAIIDPLLSATMNVVDDLSPDNLVSQPNASDIRNLLGSENRQDLGIVASAADEYDSLISQMLGCRINPPPKPQTCSAPASSNEKTRQIVKAVCASVVGSAVMLVQ